MKRILIPALILVGSAYFLATAATFQPIDLGMANIVIASSTVNSIMNSTATIVGRQKWCYNCTANGGAGTLCTSTGTTGAFQYVLSTGTACK